MFVGRCLGAAVYSVFAVRFRREINPRPTVKHKHIFQFNIGLDFFERKKHLYLPKKESVVGDFMSSDHFLPKRKDNIF